MWSLLLICIWWSHGVVSKCFFVVGLTYHPAIESPSFFRSVIRQKSLLWSSNSLSEGGTTRMQPMCSLSVNWLRTGININLTSAWRVMASSTNSKDVLFVCKTYANESRLPQSCTALLRFSTFIHVLIALCLGMLKYGHCIYSPPICLTRWIRAEAQTCQSPLGLLGWSHRCTRSLMATKLWVDGPSS